MSGICVEVPLALYLVGELAARRANSDRNTYHLLLN